VVAMVVVVSWSMSETGQLSRLKATLISPPTTAACVVRV